MSRILLAWELGNNLGHIDRLLTLAQALRARGHSVRFVLRDLSRAQARVAGAGFTMGQAPVWLAQMTRPSQAPNYCATLERAGWLNAPGLAGLLHGWRLWFELLQPDVLVADFAPTALLAARGLGLPVWAAGTSFEIPPPGPHFPPLLPPSGGSHAAAVDAACAAADAGLLRPVNQALALLGASAPAPLPRLTDLFADVHTALLSLPELHHHDGYPASVAQPGAAYQGDAGAAPAWPDGPAPRAFVYLQPAHADFRAALQALRDGGWAALVHAPGLSDEAAGQLGSQRIRFSTVPLAVTATVAQADVVVSHGSAGLANAAALGGKPQLALPRHAEQALVARRIVQAGIGLQAAPGSTAAQLQQLLQRLHADTGIASAAATLAQRRAALRPQATGERLAVLIEQSLAAPSLT